MSVRFTREHRGYPGKMETLAVATALALPTTYATDDNGMKNIGAIVTANVDGVWYAYGGVSPALDSGHFLAVGSNLDIHGRWAVEKFKAISDNAVGSAEVAVTYLFSKPPTFA